ncbi:hypothetical protein HMPREF9418_1264 [Neisseria macacae ATCC 33926]|uniref:Uncharacterized protein n=1 Tax=Neisseria macacae ATCC 33926 TaxID=997348 RepID=A0AA36XKN8_9NEIS|nr:hypothetical protein HMPREF9418_1264 [Neisseria macacae ATCC 33926]
MAKRAGSSEKGDGGFQTTFLSGAEGLLLDLKSWEYTYFMPLRKVFN